VAVVRIVWKLSVDILEDMCIRPAVVLPFREVDSLVNLNEAVVVVLVTLEETCFNFLAHLRAHQPYPNDALMLFKHRSIS
jgi:hypothetical protein